MTSLQGLIERSKMKPKSYRTVVFEGTEASGKTTLMKEFQKTTNWRYPCIDRWLISALAYNRYKRRHQDQVFEMLQDIDDLIVSHGILVVYLVVSPEVQLKRFEARGDWLYNVEDLEGIGSAYHDIMSVILRVYPDRILTLRNHDEDLQLNIDLIKAKIVSQIGE